MGLRKYRINPYNQIPILCDRDFTFLGDVDGGQAALSCFDSQQLDVVNPTGSNVLECKYMEQLLANNNAIGLVPVVTDDAYQRQTILTRGAMWCPQEIVVKVLRKNLIPRQAYMTLYPLLKAKGLLTECENLVNLLCVGCAILYVGNAPLVSHPTVGVQVTIDSDLQKYVQKFLKCNLKGLNQKPVATLPPEL